ncbi:hypothetical protein GCM10010123_35910 [Pilimelia anulata]|uniref:Response regulatory domain-containing protein n=1 Tax=Pilimelia anulata TaxID=53371 RepID=A0A8J3BDK2_9ACTN|nr:response regulator [Pilimelia anulata]GGK02759.1 hypothetical protein GCM10010123_35910 [Pilimelia anulata]
MATVLIAEDDTDIRDLVIFRLKQAELDVIEVKDGLAAVAAALRDRPDVAVLDVAMPGLSGLEVCRQLRAAPETRHMLILLLTARAQETDIEQGFAVGADDYMTKPFSPRELATRVRSLLDRPRE